MDWIWLPLVLAALYFLWQRRSVLAADQVATLMAQGAVLVDVRSADEFRDDHVQGAINLPVDQIEHQATKQLTDSQRPVLLYCLSGTRSAMAVGKLRQLGYQHVHNLGSLGRARRVLGST